MKSALKFLLLLLIVLIVFASMMLRDKRPPIYFAVAHGDTTTVARYVEAGSNINTQIITYEWGRRYGSLLHIAVDSANPEMVEFLLRSGADPNRPNSEGLTPLSCAILLPDAARANEIIRLLVNHGADPNHPDKTPYRYTPLISAVSLEKLPLAETLLSLGANVNQPISDGRKALDFSESTNMSSLLLRYGATRRFERVK